MSSYRVIPSVDQLRRRPSVIALETQYGHAAVVDALRTECRREVPFHNGLDRRNPARLVTVRSRVTVDEPRREFF